MITQLLKHFLAGTDPEKIKSWFYLGQVGVAGLIIAGVWWLREREPRSGFKVREADLGKARPKSTKDRFQLGEDPLANARYQKKSDPLRLSGIVIQGAPHEILQIAPTASEDEIRASYRALMKRYHPDSVGRPGTPEWSEAQKIAEAINRAKEEMLAKVRSR